MLEFLDINDLSRMLQGFYDWVGQPSGRLWLFGWLVLVMGCGPPEYCRFSGMVMYQGKPIQYLQITLSPVSPDSVRDAIAVTDETGRFTMTQGTKRAILRGRYFVYFEDPLAADEEVTSTEPEYLELIRRYPPFYSELVIDVQRHYDNHEFVFDIQ